MLHWITFKNELPARDVARIRKIASTLQGGSTAATHQPTTRFSLSTHQPVEQQQQYQQQVLRAGARQPSRYFYKTDARGRRLSSQVYVLQHGGPVHVARQVAKAVMRSCDSSRHRVPSSVQSAVQRAVADGYVTDRRGRMYCDKYAKDAGKGKVLLHIRERGKHKVRQYEATCVMKKHPSKHNIRDMQTKHVSVSYVQTFAC